MMRGHYNLMMIVLLAWFGCGESEVQVENTSEAEVDNAPKLCKWIPADSACSYAECTHTEVVAKSRIRLDADECSVVETEKFPLHLCTWSYEPGEPVFAVTNIGRSLFYRETPEGFEFVFRGSQDTRVVRENHGYANEWVYCGDVTVINKPAECGLCPNTLPN